MALDNLQQIENYGQFFLALKYADEPRIKTMLHRFHEKHPDKYREYNERIQKEWKKQFEARQKGKR